VTYLNTKNKNENIHLINAWHKYGRENFSYYVIEYLYDEDSKKLEQLLKDRELYWIKELDTTNRDKGYNMRIDSDSKCFVLDETRERCRQAQIERFKDESEREKISVASKKAHIVHKESFESAKEKLAYANRKYRIAQCNKNTGDIIKIYEIIKDILIDYPDFYLQAIKGCCQGTKRSYRGYRWHYCDLEESKLILKGMYSEEL